MSFYQSITAVSQPIDIGLEAGTGRQLYSTNYNVKVHNPSSSLEEEIAKYLEDNSHGTRAVSIFWSSSGPTPPSVDNTVFIHIAVLSGAPSLKTFGKSHHKTDRPNFQLTFVCKNPDICKAKAHACYNLLDPIYNTTLVA